MVRQKCDPKMAKEFDNSRLRTLISAGVVSARDLARRTADKIAGLDAEGPPALPVLRAALEERRLKFGPATDDDGSSPCIRLHSSLL
jgi:hypothetical protein